MDSMNKKRILVALLLALIMVGSAFAVLGNATGVAGNAKSTNILSANVGGLNLKVNDLVQSQASSSTPWLYPTDNATTEPHYTGGVFKIGQIGNAGSMSPFDETTYCDAFVDCQIWGATALFETLPNGTNVPWMASGYTVATAAPGSQTYDITTNSYQNYSYVYTVNIRPYVRWTDWSPANNSQTYVFPHKRSIE